MKQKVCQYIIVDWGTSNFRAFAMSEDHQLLASRQLALGLLQIKEGRFAQSLASVLEEWLGDYQHLSIYMAGMVGSLKGWINVDYVATPACAQVLARKTHRLILPWGAQAFIIPGISHQFEQDKFDVMRGEEVQALGLVALVQQQTCSAIFPGTHSKHIKINEGEIFSFSSYLTGEMYDVLSKYSLLGKDLIVKESIDKHSFLTGVRDGQQGEFTQRIFLAWTRRLFKQIAIENTADYLSGLLIGFELRHACKNSLHYLVGSEALCNRYQMAAKELAISNEVVNGDACFLKGMTTLIEQLTGDSEH